MPTTEGVLHRLGLGSAWDHAVRKELEAAGVTCQDGVWEPHGVAVWVRRMLAGSDLLTATDLRVTAMRLASYPSPAIRSRARSRLRGAELDRRALMLALRYTHDLAPLRTGRAGHRLVTAGLGAGGERAVVVQRAIEKQWAAGTDRATIAAAFELGPNAAGRLWPQLPRRLTSGAVTARFGWSADNVFQKLSRGTFPPADGVDGRTKWWWPATVDAWEAGRTLIQCPVCSARVERLTTHLLSHRGPADGSTQP